MKMLIDSQWVEAANGQYFEVFNPATGATIDRVPQATSEDAQLTLDAAQRGKENIKNLPAHERSAILDRVARAMAAQSEELSSLLAQENGKPIQQSLEELAAAVSIFRGFAEEAKRIFSRTVPLDTVPGAEKHFAVTIRQPLGVVLAVVPFNYPVELYAHKGAAALAAGNAVIAKPPDETVLPSPIITKDTVDRYYNPDSVF